MALWANNNQGDMTKITTAYIYNEELEAVVEVQEIYIGDENGNPRLVFPEQVI